MSIEQEFRTMLAKDQALRDLENGTAKAVLLETLPATEAEGFDHKEFKK